MPWERRYTEVLLFTWQMIADAEAYIAMIEDEVEEEYRRAGKLHSYDPDKERQKRISRIARRWPPPDRFIPEISEYLKLIEEDEQDDGIHQPDQ
uniref:Uncharacterized protein n=1 Tax=Setaria italica TaxID=4555 RepID=K3XQM2_SETIT